MSDPETLPPGRSLLENETIRPRVLLLPAFVADPPLDERQPWLERYAFTDAIDLDGLESPLYLAESGVAMTLTGIGKSDAATTTTAILAHPQIDLSEALIISAGIAGGSPDRVALGSVGIADIVVDWDRKHRWDEADLTAAERDGPPLDLLAYRPHDYVHYLEPPLVTWAQRVGTVPLEDRPVVRRNQDRYPASVDQGPTVAVGPTVCGDEFWHGPSHAAAVNWLCRAYGVDPFLTTQMEDAATATALERFDALDRYLSLRAVVNYDRPSPGESVYESFDGTTESVELGLENLGRVGGAIVARVLEDGWP